MTTPARRVAAESRPATPMVWVALVTVYLLWGSTYLAIREAINTMPPFLMASVRYLVAGGLLYAVAIRRGDRAGDRPGRPQWRAAIVIGGLLLLGGNGGVVWSEQHIPSGITAILVATIPLWMVLIGTAAFREHVGNREIAGVVVGFAGIVLLVLGSGSGTGGGHLDVAGVAGVVIAAMCWATGSLYSRRAALPARPLVSTAMQMLAGGVLLGVAGVATGELGRVHPSQISLASTLGLAHLIVFGSLVAFTAYVWLLQNARLSLVATYPYVNPVVAVFLGWAILGEPVTWATIAASAVIGAGVALIVTAQRARSRAQAAEADAVEADEPPAGAEVATVEGSSALAVGAVVGLDETPDDDAA